MRDIGGAADDRHISCHFIPASTRRTIMRDECGGHRWSSVVDAVFRWLDASYYIVVSVLFVIAMSLQSTSMSPSSFVRRLATMMACVCLVKHATRQARPDKSDRHSFPSGHAALAAFVAQALTAEDVVLWAWAWAILAGCMRVMLRRHHAHDVGIGWIMGSIWAVV